MLIDERLGTWFFLAEILTTLELPTDEPVEDRCGTCERCIKACPTGAITAPHRLDARRCISYLTIELKGSIPLELRPLIGDRIFGCDDCLDVCPWNRFAQVSHETAFSARKSTTGMALRDYLRTERRGVSPAFRKFTDQTNQAARLSSQCMRRLGQCRRPVRSCRRSNARQPIRSR